MPAITLNKPHLSIVIPTFNESENIINLLESIKLHLNDSIPAEIIVVDDNSPDGTGKIVDNYINKLNLNDNIQSLIIKIIHRERKEGLIKALVHGIKSALGKQILIMDADFSHPPEILPKIIEKIKENNNCIIVASRYTEGGSINGWPLKRRLISWIANRMARLMLDIDHIKDPMSGFFTFPKESIKKMTFETKGYKILLELLVKEKNIKVIEIPYIFSDRKSGKSKLNYLTIINYLESLWKLYRYGKKANLKSSDQKKSIKFFSKAGRFFTVGLSGLFVNYIISVLLSNGFLAKFWYLEATSLGIIVSITSNFFLNKFWTFEDKNFSSKYLIKQYLLFLMICSFGASMQLGLVYMLVESNLSYESSLLLAVIGASVSNFILNKKFTFKEKIWG